MTTRKITRKSDHFVIITPSSLPGTAWCPSCKDGKLIVRKSDKFNAFCPNCGELVPIKAVKFDTGLIQKGFWPQPTALVQNKEWTRRPKPRSLNPIERELIGKGHVVIDSDWGDQKL